MSGSICISDIFTNQKMQLCELQKATFLKSCAKLGARPLPPASKSMVGMTMYYIPLTCPIIRAMPSLFLPCSSRPFVSLHEHLCNSTLRK